MTQGEMDRPEDESERQGPRAEEGQHRNYVPGSAADPRMRQQAGSGTDSGAYYGAVSNPEERSWSTLIHLSALSAILFPFVGNWLAPLIVWLLFRARSDMVDYHGKRALNFQISMTVYILLASILSFVLIGIPFLIGLGFIWLIWTIVAGVRASRGDPPGYILSIGFLK